MQECKLFMNITPYTVISIGTLLFAYMPTLERLKAVEGLENCFSEGRKMVHSVAFWI